MLSSPTRKGHEGSVTFIGRQEHEDEVLRSHYLLNKIKSKDQLLPPHI